MNQNNQNIPQVIMHNSLHEHLQNRQDFKGKDWTGQLDARKLEELEFHNFERELQRKDVIAAQQESNVHANKKYYSISRSSRRWVDDWIARHAKGRVFLDYACGNGERAIQAARAGAVLSVGLDISDVSVENARRSARLANLSGVCSFIQGDCEATELPSDSFDTILCSGMLHHLDLNVAYPELFRILKPGGRLLGVEALGHNPFIQIYRNLTPHLRTEWEAKHILKMKDIKQGEKLFLRGETKYWHLLAIAAVPFRRSRLFSSVIAIAESLDSSVLKLPWIQLLAWQVTFELIKPSK